jgi:hypothetical protein
VLNSPKLFVSVAGIGAILTPFRGSAPDFQFEACKVVYF